MDRRQFLFRAAGAYVLSLSGCKSSSLIAPRDTIQTSQQPIRLIISAAASMQDVLGQLQISYKTIAPTTEIIYNFGSSGSLAQQIIQGAPVDLFLAAAPQWMNVLAEKQRILNNSRQALVQNSMVLVVPNTHGRIIHFQNLSTVNKVAIGEPNSVPAGHYAREVLMSLDLFDRLQSKLVFGKNVRHVLAYVETGHVDAGLIYGTDALISQRVQVVATAPVNSHSAIVYSVAVVKDSPQVASAQAFIEFLVSDAALAIFETYGFTPF